MNEIEMLKKQKEQDSDTIRIKNKIVDDQTETIRRLKEVSAMSDKLCAQLKLRLAVTVIVKAVMKFGSALLVY